MPFRFRRAALAALITAIGCAPVAQTPSTPAVPASISPNAQELRRDLFVFAADSFGGRETGTPYADKAAQWIADRLKQLGVQPGGDSGYFARVPMERTEVVTAPITITSAGATRTLTYGRDIAFLTALGPGAPLPKNAVDAEVVFAGYGLVDPTLKRDDYAGLNVTGKVLVIAALVPPDASAEKRKEMENPQALFGRLSAAIGRQPAAVVLLMPDSVYRLAAGQFAGTQLALATGAAEAAPRPRMFPFIAVLPYDPLSPLVPAGWPTSGSASSPAATRFSASYTEQKSPVTGYNVVGTIPGTDAALRNTYVAFGAHYDHIGIQHGLAGDSIANGADDDGSGSVTLLAIARAWMAGPRPKRSALFVWHIGEEKGLFGSEAFTRKPTVPIDSIVAQLNADMIGRNGPDSLYIVGPGAAPNGQSTVVGAVVDSVNASGGKPFVFDREWDTTTHPERIYFRSDHFNYARKGIPIVFFTTGLHPQYHKVTDEAALINYEKMARIGDLMYQTGMALGNRPTRPRPTGVQ